MKVFVGMETSGMTRRAFRAAGHEVISCDLLPADDDAVSQIMGLDGITPMGCDNRGGLHIQGDVFDALQQLGPVWWPDLAIFHPTCTYLTYSAEWAYGDGPYHMKLKPETLVGAARRAAREAAIEQFHRLLGLSIRKICAENPRGAFDRVSPGYQVIQPYMFGDDASKETILHLVGLPPLEIPPRAEWVKPRMVNGRPRWGNQTDGGQNRLSPGPNRWKERSATYPGIADAFTQWAA